MRSSGVAYNAVLTTVVGEMLDEPWWNTNIRANMQHFANIHDHGSTNHGARTIGGTGGLIYARFTDGSDPAAPGVGKTVIYSKSGKLFQRAGAAGSAEQIEITTHTH